MSARYFGLDRSLSQEHDAGGGGTTQSAAVVDASLPLRPGEVLVEVTCLLLDAASAFQLHEAHAHGGPSAAEAIADIVKKRGKMHNPVTCSGGVLLGRVASVEASPADVEWRQPRVGERIVPLVSLSCIPLSIRRILSVDGERVTCEAHAILFPCHPVACVDGLPFSESVAVAAIDVSSIVVQVCVSLKGFWNSCSCALMQMYRLCERLRPKQVYFMGAGEIVFVFCDVSHLADTHQARQQRQPPLPYALGSSRSSRKIGSTS